MSSILQSKQVPFAVARSLNEVAGLSKTGIQAAMQTSFQNPTPYTLGSMYLERATKTKPVAVLQFKDKVSRGTPASRYLGPEVTGGKRQAKPFEFIEQRRGVLPSNRFMVPTRELRLNRYGNVPLAQLEKIMAAATGAKYAKSKRQGGKAADEMDLFVGAPGGGRLPMGIWQRMKDGSIRPLFLFVQSSTYRVKLPIGQIAGDIYTKDFAGIFQKFFAEAMATAK